jgi:drug/metabolite transporter (DMT)-like permease
VLLALVLGQAFGGALTAVAVLVTRETIPDVLPLAWSGAAGLGGLVGLACLYLALSRGTMGLVAPLTALIAAVLPASVGLVAGEAAPPILLVGMVVALAAVVVISLPERELVPPPDATAAASASTSITGARGQEWLLIALSGLGFACFYLGVDRAHASGGGVWWTLAGVRIAALTAAVLVIVVMFAMHRGPSMRVTRTLLPLTVLAAVGDTGGNLFYILARSAGTLSTTVVLASLYPVSTTVLARVLLGERLSRTRLLGVALAVLGVALIGLGAVEGS